MNKEFMKKMIKAKRMEYEALREIMPESMVSRISAFEEEAVSMFKAIAIELIKDDIDEKKSSEPIKKVKKIGIE